MRVIEPRLLDMTGRVAHDQLEDEIEAIEQRRYPGWQVVYDDIGLERARSSRGGWMSSILGLTDLDARLHGISVQVPQRVWVVVLEHQQEGRREVVKFLLTDGEDESPTWARIRADASDPV